MKVSNIIANRNLFDLSSRGLKEGIKRAAEFLSQGGVIAVPTDTVYGLACDVQNDTAIARLYGIKGRSPKNPISICVGEVDSLRHWAKTEHLPFDLLNALLPGPVTVVLVRSPLLNPLFNSHTNKVGIRIPESQFIKGLARSCISPLALTSANKSGEDASLDINEFKDLWAELDAVFDSGKIKECSKQRQGSTVVDLSIPNFYTVIREGVSCIQTCDILKKFGWLDAAEQISLSETRAITLNCSS